MGEFILLHCLSGFFVQYCKVLHLVHNNGKPCHVLCLMNESLSGGQRGKTTRSRTCWVRGWIASNPVAMLFFALLLMGLEPLSIQRLSFQTSPCPSLGNWVCGGGRRGNKTFLGWNNIWLQLFRERRKALSCGRLLMPKIITAMVITFIGPWLCALRGATFHDLV